MHCSSKRQRLGAAAFAATLGLAGALPATMAQAEQTWSAGTATEIAVPATGTEGVADPYPSTVELGGLQGVVTKVEVSLVLSHESPEDLDLLLVGPGGENAIIMSDVGDGTAVDDVELVLADDADTELPIGAELVSGRFEPTNNGGGDTFPDPAPAPSGDSNLAVFVGTDPNGEWSLYVVDDATDNTGTIRSWGVTVWTDGPDLYNPVTPARVFDTRAEQPQGTVDVPKVKVEAGETLAVKVTGTAGVPDEGVGAISMNLTVNQPEADGYVTAFPCTGEQPETSSVNFRRGVTVANPVVIPVSDDGEVCFFAARTAHLIGDVNGWFADSNLLRTVPPIRAVDTRAEQPQGAIVVEKGKLGADEVLELSFDGVGGIEPGWAQAVSVNLTVQHPEGDGFATLYPCEDTVPPTSSINFRAGQTVANAAVVPLSDDGKLCVYTARTTSIIIDLTAWFATPVVELQGFNALAPTRLLDTRPEQPQGAVTVEKEKVAAGEHLEVTIAGAAGLPESGIAGVVLNVTVQHAEDGGFVTVYPCGDLPPTSSLNFRTGQTTSNAVITPVSDEGTICIYAARTTHVIADISGWFAASEIAVA